MPKGTLDGVDLAAARRRVHAEGGETGIFMTAMGWAAAALTTSPTREALLTLSACAAWRAGVIGIRSDALRRAAAAPALALAVAGALLMPPEMLPGFLAAQRADPFGWHTPLPGGRVADVGGFAGFGGPWLRPPTAYGPFPGRQDFWIAADDRRYWLRADIFGHRLSLVETAPLSGSRAGARLERPAENTYLLRILA